jgi:hypothetical protein
VSVERGRDGLLILMMITMMMMIIIMMMTMMMMMGLLGLGLRTEDTLSLT